MMFYFLTELWAIRIAGRWCSIKHKNIISTEIEEFRLFENVSKGRYVHMPGIIQNSGSASK